MVLDLAEIENLNQALIKLNSLKLKELEFVVSTPKGEKKLKFSSRELEAAYNLTSNNFDYLMFLFNFYRAFPEKYVEKIEK